MEALHAAGIRKIFCGHYHRCTAEVYKYTKNKQIFPNSVVIFFENGKGKGMNNNFQKNVYPGEDS